MTGAGLPVPHDVAPAHVRPGWGFAGFPGFRESLGFYKAAVCWQLAYTRLPCLRMFV